MPDPFAEHLRDHRVRRRLSQARLGRLIDVGQQTISRWETGHVVPDRTRIQALARALGADPNRLLHAAGHLPPAIHSTVPAALNDLLDDDLWNLADRTWRELLRRHHEHPPSVPQSPAPQSPAPQSPAPQSPAPHPGGDGHHAGSTTPTDAADGTPPDREVGSAGNPTNR